MAPELVFEPEGKVEVHGFERNSKNQIVQSKLTHEFYLRALADQTRYDAVWLMPTVRSMYPDATDSEVFALAMLTCVTLPVAPMIHLCRLKQNLMRGLFKSVEDAMNFVHMSLTLSSRLFSEKEEYGQFARHFVYKEDIDDDAKLGPDALTIEFHVMAARGGTISMRRLWSAADPAVRLAEKALMLPAPDASFFGLVDGKISEIAYLLSVRACKACDGISIPRNLCFYNQRSKYFFSALDDLKQKGFFKCRCKNC